MEKGQGQQGTFWALYVTHDYRLNSCLNPSLAPPAPSSSCEIDMAEIHKSLLCDIMVCPPKDLHVTANKTVKIRVLLKSPQTMRTTMLDMETLWREEIEG